MPSFRILVLSDLHMHQGAPNLAASPSYLSSIPAYSLPKVNPIRDAVDLLKEKNLAIDWIICPGDIADKNDVVSAGVAWSSLEQMRRRLHARRLVGTIGNHDVDSRREEQYQVPDDALRNLNPKFPFSDQTFSRKFWTDHYVIWKDARTNATLVVLNTCALHGVAVPPGDDAEHKRGYITERTLNSLRAELPGRLSHFNILVMHHHIRQHPWLPGDESHAINGPLLVELLRETGKRWLVIHGHLHLPDLSYADAGQLAPVILSAGSVAAKTYSVRGRTPRNQMYVIDFDIDAAAAIPPRMRGRVHAWNWAPAIGWTEAFKDSGLPWLCGFGEYGGLPNLVGRIKTALEAAPARRLRWRELVAQIPESQYLVPDDMEQLILLLEADAIVVDYDRFQVPSVLARGA